jgi:hypothetical protein
VFVTESQCYVWCTNWNFKCHLDKFMAWNQTYFLFCLLQTFPFSSLLLSLLPSALTFQTAFSRRTSGYCLLRNVRTVESYLCPLWQKYFPVGPTHFLSVFLVLRFKFIPFTMSLVSCLWARWLLLTKMLYLRSNDFDRTYLRCFRSGAWIQIRRVKERGSGDG